MRMLRDKVNHINRMFNDFNVGLRVEIVSAERGEVEINIEWGDWKHEHGYADYVMKENLFQKTCEKITEEDGSDCYSSIHYYRFALPEMLKR